MNIVDKIKALIFSMNEKGIPVPLARNPNTDNPDIIFTFLYLAGLLAIASAIGKFTKLLGDIDISAANYFYLTSAGLFLGRHMVGDTNKKTVDLDGTEKKEEK